MKAIQLRNGFYWTGIMDTELRVFDIIMYTEGRDATLPKCCILMEKMGLYCHYLVYYDGKFYDPNLGIITEYDMSKLQGYLEVKVE